MELQTRTGGTENLHVIPKTGSGAQTLDQQLLTRPNRPHPHQSPPRLHRPPPCRMWASPPWSCCGGSRWSWTRRGHWTHTETLIIGLILNFSN